jgi:hypothetical protein
MTQTHPITPPDALVKKIRSDALCSSDGRHDYELSMIHAAYTAGADQELEAVEKEIIAQAWFANSANSEHFRAQLRAALAQPEPVAPTDEDLLSVRSWSCHGPTFDSDLVDFARAVLAKWGNSTPQPPADGEVAELVEWLLREADYQEITVKRATCADRIRRAACLLEHPTPQPPAELAEMVKRLHEINSPTPQPVAEGPMDEEIIQEAIKSDLVYRSCDSEETVFCSFTECYPLNQYIISLVRAVLARMRAAAIQPVAVSERLPEPEDCDAEGRCWMFDPCDRGWWCYREALPSDGDPEPFTHWLPHWALPVPAPAIADELEGQ